MQFSLEI